MGFPGRFGWPWTRIGPCGRGWGFSCGGHCCPFVLTRAHNELQASCLQEGSGGSGQCGPCLPCLQTWQWGSLAPCWTEWLLYMQEGTGVVLPLLQVGHWRWRAGPRSHCQVGWSRTLVLSGPGPLLVVEGLVEGALGKDVAEGRSISFRVRKKQKWCRSTKVCLAK